ncbi:hypothetical protein AB1Y20_011937 [Prymnesium parvum]|uniref:Mitochondrial inner membrane protease subunit n=1 Tax=Prymnesium parvum TaxID=97485 RepID=A0AB34IN10_PRYPA
MRALLSSHAFVLLLLFTPCAAFSRPCALLTARCRVSRLPPAPHVAASHEPDGHRPAGQDGSPRPPSRRNLLSVLFPALCLVLLVRTYLVEPYFIPSMSMYPTLLVNDQIAVEKFSRFLSPPQRGDLVVFSPPPTYFQMGKPSTTKALVKRVVAVAGDAVEMRGGTLFLNGMPMYEPYVRERPNYSLGPLEVPVGSIFVLGDNRNDSSDSHIWGSLPIENVVGKAFYIVWPIERQGFVDEVMQDLEITRNAEVFIQRLRLSDT